jgi:transcriptional regulator with XRE-family HTH domain
MAVVQVHPLKALCLERGLKLRWVASQLDMSPQHLSGVMCGDRPAPAAFYENVSTILNVPIELVKPAEVAAA